MANFFYESEGNAGFRLQYFQLYNWGTFRNNWDIAPNSKNSVLYGANGAGKTTFVDAMISLLVPQRAIAYNQASGVRAKGKKGRTAQSYFEGHFGEKMSENNVVETQKLRGVNDYTVLLGCFYNALTQQYVTLAQLWFMQGTDLKKMFFVATKALKISTHFRLTEKDTKEYRSLKKRFELIKDINIFNDGDFVQYRKFFSEKLGIPTHNDNALKLLGKIVGIKEIERLDEFIREQMLDEMPVGEIIEKVYKKYEDLIEIDNKIKTDEKQLEMLNKVADNGTQYEVHAQRVEELEKAASQIEPYFAHHKLKLIEGELEEKKRDLQGAQTDLESLKTQISDTENAKTQLQIAIESNDTQRRITDLEKEIRQKETEKTPKEREYQKYKESIRQINTQNPYVHLLTQVESSDDFFLNQQEIKEKKARIEEDIQTLEKEINDNKLTKLGLDEKYKSLIAEINEYSKRPSNIPPERTKIREMICKDLIIKESELPFVGECIQIKENEKQWEGAIERLLNNFAITLLVPERHRQEVISYINRQHLGGRIKCEIPDEKNNTHFNTYYPKNGVFEKLDIKQEKEFSDWLAKTLKERFNFECYEDSNEEFRRTRERALTMQGTIKRHTNTFEKNDLNKVSDRKYYVLGWSNAEKIALLREEATVLHKRINGLSDALQGQEKELKKQNNLFKAYEKGLDFKDFEEMNYLPLVREIQELIEEKLELEQSDDIQQIAKLKEQLETLTKKLQERKDAEKAAIQLEGGVLKDIENLGKEASECRGKLTVHDETLLKDLVKLPLHSRFVNREKERVTNLINNELGEVKDQKSSSKNATENAMRDFCNAYPEFHDLRNEVSFISEFQQLKEKIEKDDLPSHKKSFDNLMKNEMLDAVTLFSSHLDVFRKKVTDDLKNINSLLKEIQYSDNSYIQISDNETGNQEVKDFRQQLKETFSNSVGIKDNEKEQRVRYEKIRKLIEDMKNREEWRKRVTDVRLWFQYGAKEFHKETNEQLKYYKDVASLSGGQKTQLTYAILASAVALHYGLRKKNEVERMENTFRFVILDEAFARFDEERARFVMNLFKTLGLQLLVVVPDKDKINHIMYDIHAIHYITNTEDKNNSTVFDIYNFKDLEDI